jgi:hypothetical protein
MDGIHEGNKESVSATDPVLLNTVAGRLSREENYDCFAQVLKESVNKAVSASSKLPHVSMS